MSKTYKKYIIPARAFHAKVSVTEYDCSELFEANTGEVSSKLIKDIKMELLDKAKSYYINYCKSKDIPMSDENLESLLEMHQFSVNTRELFSPQVLWNLVDLSTGCQLLLTQDELYSFCSQGNLIHIKGKGLFSIMLNKFTHKADISYTCPNTIKFTFSLGKPTFMFFDNTEKENNKYE